MTLNGSNVTICITKQHSARVNVKQKYKQYNQTRPALSFGHCSVSSVIFGCVSLLRQPVIPTAHYSDDPLFRQSITPTAHFSDNIK